MCLRLGYGQSMNYTWEDVNTENESEADWSSFEVVFLAALVGIDTLSKFSILASLSRKLRPGTLIAARSAHGLRRVLYPV